MSGGYFGRAAKVRYAQQRAGVAVSGCRRIRVDKRSLVTLLGECLLFPDVVSFLDLVAWVSKGFVITPPWC